MIWCVEDDASIRDIEVYALNSTGFSAEGFADGAAFWAALEKDRPELVVLDVMLPEIDGIQLLRRMKADPALRDIPVIMATAKGAEYDRVRALDGGADGLDFYRLLTAHYRDALRPGGWLVLEIGCAQAADVLALGAANGWVNGSCRKDYGSNDRAVLLQKPEKSC